jgi:hypothetical protein
VAGIVTLVLGAVLQLASASHPAVVERLYSRRVFPAVQRVMGHLTAWTAVSLGETLVLALVAVSLTLTMRTLARPSPFRERFLSVLAGLSLAAVAVYWAFLLLWGLNYSREPFGTSARLDTSPASADELESLSRSLAEEADAARARVEEDGAGVMRLRAGREGALRLAPDGFRVVERVYDFLGGPSLQPKFLLLSPLVSYAGISGIYSPFTGEANVNSTLPDPDLPFAASHEIAHQRGFAREDEANYLGYLACRLHPDPDFRYSGLLSASLYAQHALSGARRAAADNIEKMRSPGVRRDILALKAWADRYEGPVQEAGERVNDAYLKTQGQAAGIQSYGQVVDLLLAERRANATGDRAR